MQYPDVYSAMTAKQALEGHAIYEGGYNKVGSNGGCEGHGLGCCRTHKGFALPL